MRFYSAISALVLGMALVGCKVDLQPDAKTKIIGHGGMGITHDYPLNSVEGIAYALHRGADGVEMDVQMTKDSVLVAYHHARLEYTMKGSGQIHDKNWDEVRNEQYRELLYSGYGVVSVEDILKYLPEFVDRYFFFDVKSFSPDTTGVYQAIQARQLVKLINQYNLSNTVVEIKSIDEGLRYKELSAEQPVFLYNNDPNLLDTCVVYGFQGIVRDIDQLNATVVNRADSLALKVTCINTHSTDRNDEAHTIGVHYNQTDMVNYALRTYR